MMEPQKEGLLSSEAQIVRASLLNADSILIEFSNGVSALVSTVAVKRLVIDSPDSTVLGED